MEPRNSVGALPSDTSLPHRRGRRILDGSQMLTGASGPPTRDALVCSRWERHGLGAQQPTLGRSDGTRRPGATSRVRAVQEAHVRSRSGVKFSLGHRASDDNGAADPDMSMHTRVSRHLHRNSRRHRRTRALLTWLDAFLPILLPTNRRRRSWDILILVFVMYNSVSVPYEASFRYTKTALQNHIETVIDILFALDVVITFRTAYIDNHAIMVRDGGKIVMHYVKTWFLIDLMASLPLDSFVLLFNSSGNANLTYFALLKTPRLLRLGRLLRFLEKIKHANVFRIIRLMLGMCLIAHWTACIWHALIAYFPDLDFSIEITGKLADEYLTCFYGSFVLMVGDNVNPVNNVERVFCCIMLVLGANFYATVVGNMSLLVANLNATAARHNQRAETIQEAMRYLNVSSQMQSRVQEYYDYLSSYSHPGPDLMLHINDLPSSLSTDMTTELYRPILESIELFAGVTDAFIASICQALKLSVYLPGEHIFKAGAVCTHLYVCHKGKVALVDTDGLIAEMHSSGSFFGQDTLIVADPHNCSAVALTSCDIMFLRGADIFNAMETCSTSSVAVRENARRLKQVHSSRPAVHAVVEPAAPPAAVEPRRKAPADRSSPRRHGSSGEASAPHAAGTGAGGAAARPSRQSGHEPDELEPAQQAHASSLERIEQMVELLLNKVNVLEMEQAEHGRLLHTVRAQTGQRALFDDSNVSDPATASARAVVARSMNALLHKVRRDAAPRAPP